MILKVKFRDNDFSTVVFNACEDFMYETMNGYKGKEAFERYEECKKEYGLDKIKLSIVKASYGHYIVIKSIQLYHKIELEDLETDILKYLNDEISVEEVSSFKEEWENKEVCYIDFYNGKVYLQ